MQERKKQRLAGGDVSACAAASAAIPPATPVAARHSVVLVHDLDETLLIFNSLLSGSWAAAHQLRGDPAAVAHVSGTCCWRASPCCALLRGVLPPRGDLLGLSALACWVLPALQLLQLGARWEAAILRLCDERFFFGEVRRCRVPASIPSPPLAHPHDARLLLQSSGNSAPAPRAAAAQHAVPKGLGRPHAHRRAGSVSPSKGCSPSELLGRTAAMPTPCLAAGPHGLTWLPTSARTAPAGASCLQLEEYDQTCLADIQQFDDGRSLSGYDFGSDGFPPPGRRHPPHSPQQHASAARPAPFAGPAAGGLSPQAAGLGAAPGAAAAGEEQLAADGGSGAADLPAAAAGAGPGPGACLDCPASRGLDEASLTRLAYRFRRIALLHKFGLTALGGAQQRQEWEVRRGALHRLGVEQGTANPTTPQISPLLPSQPLAMRVALRLQPLALPGAAPPPSPPPPLAAAFRPSARMSHPPSTHRPAGALQRDRQGHRRVAVPRLGPAGRLHLPAGRRQRRECGRARGPPAGGHPRGSHLGAAHPLPGEAAAVQAGRAHPGGAGVELAPPRQTALLPPGGAPLRTALHLRGRG